MWVSDAPVGIRHYVVFVTLLGAFLWKISVQCHTYTSLNILIVIIRVSLDDRWHFFFFFFLEMHKILYFWNCNWSSSVYCAQTGGGQRFGTLVMWTRLYQFMRWPKWNTPTAWLYINTQHAPLTADAALFPLSVSSHCLKHPLYRFSAVWLWSVLIPPLQHINSEWQLTDQVAGCHGDESSVRPTASSAAGCGREHATIQ